VETGEHKARQVSRVGSRFALIMLFAAAILGVVLTSMSALQLRQVRSFSRQILGMRARSAAMAFFVRYMRQPERGVEKIPKIVDDAALGTADYIQVLDADGEVLGSYLGSETGSIPDADPGSLRATCTKGFRRLDEQLPWRSDGTVRLQRGIVGAILRPAGRQLIEVDDHTALDALFALPGPDILRKCRPRGERAHFGKCKGLELARADMLAENAPCMIVRVGIDATAQEKAINTHWWILGLAILTTLVVLGINLALYRALKQRERLAENLERAQRIESLGEMAATLAHELKNPVGAIRGYAQLMREAQEAGNLAADDPESERVKRAVETIVRESARLEQLVRRTLEFARPGDLELAKLDLREAADAAASLMAKKAEEAGVSIVTDHDAAAVEIEVDRGRMEQVIANLLDNAIEASEKGGTVAVSVRSGSDSAILEVRDQGRGIAPDRLGRIFQPFDTTKAEGTGLGLAVSRSIVEAHKGTIETQSQGEGKGAVFTVTIPR
jgi:two-component system sensor histidine kinase HydH